MKAWGWYCSKYMRTNIHPISIGAEKIAYMRYGAATDPFRPSPRDASTESVASIVSI